MLPLGFSLFSAYSVSFQPLVIIPPITRSSLSRQIRSYKQRSFAVQQLVTAPQNRHRLARSRFMGGLIVNGRFDPCSSLSSNATLYIS